MNAGPSARGQPEEAVNLSVHPETAISTEAILSQLEKILASPGFIHSDRMVRFLRFTVDQALKGHASELKETVLGMEVFDRPSSFDPRTDTIVRVEARRLRSKLKEYYEGEGRGDSIRIDFPKGSYVPTFLLANGRGEAPKPITSPLKPISRQQILPQSSLPKFAFLAPMAFWNGDRSRPLVGGGQCGNYLMVRSLFAALATPETHAPHLGSRPDLSSPQFLPTGRL